MTIVVVAAVVVAVVWREMISSEEAIAWSAICSADCSDISR